MSNELPRPGISLDNRARSIVDYDAGVRFIEEVDPEQGRQLDLLDSVGYEGDTFRGPMLWQPDTYRGHELRQYSKDFEELFLPENREVIREEVMKVTIDFRDALSAVDETVGQRFSAIFHGLRTLAFALDVTLTKPGLFHAFTESRLSNGLSIIETMSSLEPVTEKGFVFYRPSYYQVSGESLNIPAETTKSILNEVMSQYDY